MVLDYQNIYIKLQVILFIFHCLFKFLFLTSWVVVVVEIGAIFFFFLNGFCYKKDINMNEITLKTK